MRLPAELSGIPDGSTQFVDCSASFVAADGTLKEHLVDQVGGWLVWWLGGWLAGWLGGWLGG